MRAGSRSVQLANFLVLRRRSLQHQRKRVRNGLPDGRMCGERGNNFCREHDSVPCGWSGQQVLAGEGRHPRPRHAPADTMYKPKERARMTKTRRTDAEHRTKSANPASTSESVRRRNSRTAEAHVEPSRGCWGHAPEMGHMLRFGRLTFRPMPCPALADRRALSRSYVVFGFLPSSPTGSLNTANSDHCLG